MRFPYMPCSRTVSLVAVLGLAGCFGALFYDGDGRFVDHGPTAAIDRYVLDLGPVNLAAKGAYRYSMAGLPAVAMAVGLELADAYGDKNLSESRPVDALIEVVLLNSRGELVIRERGHLDTWGWEYSLAQQHRAFVGLSGKLQERSLGHGVIGYERLEVKADGGWGTIFKPRRGERYSLTLSVLEPSTSARAYTAKVLVQGGGWKS